MAIYSGVTIDGARQLRSTLKRAGDDLQDLKAVHRQAAAVVAVKATGWAPVRTGRLASSIRTGATTRAAIVRAGRKTVPYANPIHWGWKARSIPANPFLSYSAKATEPTWLALFSDYIKKAIQRIEGA